MARLISKIDCGIQEVTELSVENGIYESANGMIHHNCKFCKEFFELPDGTPRAYKLSELSASYMDKKHPEPTLPGLTHPNCLLTGDARVITKDGYKKIKYIKIGDYVLTHKLRWQKVINTLDWYNTPYAKDFYTIKLNINDPGGFAVTPDHKFLTSEGMIAISELKGRKIFKVMRKCIMCNSGHVASYPGFFCSDNCNKVFFDNPIANAERVKKEEYYLEEFKPYIMYDKHTEPVKLFDITVENDHSFIVEGMVSSNCRCILLYLSLGYKLLPGGKLEYVNEDYSEYEHQNSLSKSEVDFEEYANHECDNHEPFKI